MEGTLRLGRPRDWGGGAWSGGGSVLCRQGRGPSPLARCHRDPCHHRLPGVSGPRPYVLCPPAAQVGVQHPAEARRGVPAAWPLPPLWPVLWATATLLPTGSPLHGLTQQPVDRPRTIPSQLRLSGAFHTWRQIDEALPMRTPRWPPFPLAMVLGPTWPGACLSPRTLPALPACQPPPHRRHRPPSSKGAPTGAFTLLLPTPACAQTCFVGWASLNPTKVNVTLSLLAPP